MSRQQKSVPKKQQRQIGEWFVNVKAQKQQKGKGKGKADGKAKGKGQVKGKAKANSKDTKNDGEPAEGGNVFL